MLSKNQWKSITTELQDFHIKLSILQSIEQFLKFRLCTFMFLWNNWSPFDETLLLLFPFDETLLLLLPLDETLLLLLPFDKTLLLLLPFDETLCCCFHFMKHCCCCFHLMKHCCCCFHLMKHCCCWFHLIDETLLLLLPFDKTLMLLLPLYQQPEVRLRWGRDRAQCSHELRMRADIFSEKIRRLNLDFGHKNVTAFTWLSDIKNCRSPLAKAVAGVALGFSILTWLE